MAASSRTLSGVLYCKRCLHAQGEVIYYAPCQMQCAVCRSELSPVDFADTTHHVPSTEQLLADPATSFWLKRALRGALMRDPVDASHDAEMLATVLAVRCREILRS